MEGRGGRGCLEDGAEARGEAEVVRDLGVGAALFDEVARDVEEALARRVVQRREALHVLAAPARAAAPAVRRRGGRRGSWRLRRGSGGEAHQLNWTRFSASATTHSMLLARTAM